MPRISRHRADEIAVYVGFYKDIGECVIKILIILVEADALHMIEVVFARIYVIRQREMLDGERNGRAFAAFFVGDDDIARSAFFGGDDAVFVHFRNLRVHAFIGQYLGARAVHFDFQLFRQSLVAIECERVLEGNVHQHGAFHRNFTFHDRAVHFRGNDRLADALRRDFGVCHVRLPLKGNYVVIAADPLDVLVEYIDVEHGVIAHGKGLFFAGYREVRIFALRDVPHLLCPRSDELTVVYDVGGEQIIARTQSVNRDAVFPVFGNGLVFRIESVFIRFFVTR